MPKLTFDKFTDYFTFYIDGAELQKDRGGVRTLKISTFLIKNAVKTTSTHTFDIKL